MKPIVVIDEAIETVNWRDGLFTRFGPGTIGHEIVKESPGTDLQFSRGPVAMEVTRGGKPTVEWNHVPVNHVAGAIGCRIVKGQSKNIRIGAKFMNGI